MFRDCDCKNCKYTNINGGYMPCINYRPTLTEGKTKGGNGALKRPPTVEYINDQYTDTEKMSIYYNIGIGWCLGCLTFTLLMSLFHTC